MGLELGWQPRLVGGVDGLEERPAAELLTFQGQSITAVDDATLSARYPSFDVTPERSRDNLDRLARALRALNARVFTESVPEGLPFDCSTQTLARAGLWNLVTDAGRIDVAFTPSGTGGYEDLSRNANRFEVFDTTIEVASIADIIRSKVAADRPQDRQDVPILQAILDNELRAGR